MNEDDKRFTHAFLMGDYEPLWWERIVLPFKKLRTLTSKISEMQYKCIGNRIYIYKFTFLQPTNSGTYTNYRSN